MKPKKIGKMLVVNADTGEVVAEKPNSMGLLPPPSDRCQECAGDHAWAEPHNRDSLYYQYHFYSMHGRWPDWADAMRHCAPEVQAQWRDAIIEYHCENGLPVPDELLRPWVAMR